MRMRKTKTAAVNSGRTGGRFWRRLWLGVVLTGILGTLGFGWYFFHQVTKDLPDVTRLKDFRPNTVTQVFARDGRLIGEFFAEKRLEVPYSRFPAHLIAAFLAAEDARFFEHPGVDFFGIVRAFIENLKAGEIVQGGSTITQQIVKSILLTPEKSLARKIREAVLAYRIENYLTKEQILHLYLNHIYLGNGAYGVEAAALEYFGKHVENLTLAEAALLAGLPKAPSRYAPTTNPVRAKERQAYVLHRMVENGFITAEQAKAALNQPLKFKAARPERFYELGYYTDYVRQLLEERYGRDPIYRAGFRVYTAADIELHQAAIAAINEGLQELRRRHGFRGPQKHLNPKEIEAFCQQQAQYLEKHPPQRGHLQRVVVSQIDRKQQAVYFRFGREYGQLVRPGTSQVELPQGYAGILSRLRPGDVIYVRLLERRDGRYPWLASLDPDPMAQASLVYLENRTGRVRVIVGGKDYRDSVFNRAIQARRQPGSAFKPIIYAAAIEKGYGPNSILLDEPLSLPGGRRGELWTPKNYDNTYSGPITLATALARSRNIPTVRLLVSIGLPPVINLAKAMGITTPIYPNYSSALGASEVTLFELTRAYSVFPNQGRLVSPIVIERVEDRDGRILEQARSEAHQVLSVRTSQIMTELLIGVVTRGTGQRVLVLKRPIGGKTGTTNRTRDAWFIGFTPSVTAGVWVGMDDERSLGPRETGAQAAAPIFIKFMREALKNQPVEEFPEVPATVFASRQISPVDDEAAAETGAEDNDEEDDDEEARRRSPRQVPVRSGTPAARHFLQQDLGE